jgi:altronate dehydratase small subunit
VKRAFKLDRADNVATLLQDAEMENVEIMGQGLVLARLPLRESIALGHKVAIGPIRVGCPVIKFGVVIGIATAEILPGDWVHLHNCRSHFDHRSAKLDLKTGAANETRYE